MVEVEIFSGVCGFKTVAKADTQGKYICNLQIESGCGSVSKMAEQIKEVNAMTELFKKKESKIQAANEQFIPHVTCPVTAGILKALEVCAGLALPRNATITFME